MIWQQILKTTFCILKDVQSMLKAEIAEYVHLSLWRKSTLRVLCLLSAAISINPASNVISWYLFQHFKSLLHHVQVIFSGKVSCRTEQGRSIVGGGPWYNSCSDGRNWIIEAGLMLHWWRIIALDKSCFFMLLPLLQLCRKRTLLYGLLGCKKHAETILFRVANKDPWSQGRIGVASSC